MISSSDLNNPYGSTTRPYYISKYLSKFGCEILHICNQFESNWSNINHILKKKSNSKNKLFRFFEDSFRLYNECKKFDADIFYIHQINNYFRAIPLIFLLNKPVVFDAHGSSVLELSGKNSKETFKYKFLEQLTLKKSNIIIVVSKELKQFFFDTFGARKEKIVLIKNGVDINSFKNKQSNNKIRKQLGISIDDKIILFTCPRTFPANDIALEYLFSLIPAIEKRLNQVKFIITGGGAQLMPPSTNVIYTGFVDDFASYIHAADVCIAPYPPAAVCGGTRNKIVEYFACGRAVVSTTEGMRGFDDAIPDIHFLLADNSKTFIEKICVLVNDEGLSKKLGENARRLSFNYDWADLSKQVLDVLKSVINK